MRFSVACAFALSLISASSPAFADSNSLPHATSLIASPTITPTPDAPLHAELHRRAKNPKRPKFTKRPRPHSHRPRHHPKGCTNTELIKNGNFNKNVKGWEFLPGSSTQFFWVKDSKKRPAHSGAGQGYLFVNRGYSSSFLSTTIPAVEYGNTVIVSAWLRYDAPADLSSCFISFGDNADASIPITLNSKWTKYSFETPGTGRPKVAEFRTLCTGAPIPISIYIDDVSAIACVPKNPNPECQVLPGSDNFLVNPGFECPDGITAWQGDSLYGGGNETIAQLTSKKGNPTHSGSGYVTCFDLVAYILRFSIRMAGLLLDSSQLPFPGSGIAVYQWGIPDDMSRKYAKASFWLSLDSKLNNVTGCMLDVGTNTGYYVYQKDISYLTSKWTKFEIKDIEPTNYDSFQITIYQCQSPEQPLFYLDDVYFGIDRTSPPMPTPTTAEPPSTPPPGPCTSTPALVDPGFEVGDTSNWLFFDHTTNADVMFSVDSLSTYGAPHGGSGVGVIQYSTSGGFVQLLQLLDGLCNDAVYTATAWFYIPSGYDASQCTFSLGVYAGSDPVSPTGAGMWTRVDVVFLADIDGSSSFPYVYVGINCQSTGEMIVLVDDISFGPAPPCSITPSLSDGSFEGGDTSIWNPGFAEGDETFTITTAKPRTGKKGGVLTFPSTSNGGGLSRELTTCVGATYAFRFWYFVPKKYQGISCTVSASVFYVNDYLIEDITIYDTWVEAKLDFVSGGTDNQINFGFSCLNQLQKVVIYFDDVSLTPK